MHARVYHDAEKAQFGAAQGVPGAADQRLRGVELHRRRRPQPAGALGGVRSAAAASRISRAFDIIRFAALSTAPASAIVARDAPGTRRSAGRNKPFKGSYAEKVSMSRRAAAPHRTILPDPKFGNDMLAKFINMVMERGKKSVAEKIVYGAIDRIGDKTGLRGGRRHRALAAGARQREAGGRSEVAPRRRRHLPGARRSTRLTAARPSRMRWVIEAATDREREVHGRIGWLPNCWRPPSNRGAAVAQARGHAPHGRGQQGVRALPLVGAGRRLVKRRPDLI